MIGKLLNLLFPEKCPVCSGKAGHHATAPFCSSCWDRIVPYKGAICRKCGRPLVSDLSLVCGKCIKSEPAYFWARSFGLYEGALRSAINLLKYRGIRRLARPLSCKIPDNILPQPDFIIPVPLHVNRLRQREFNQSALIARYLSDRTGGQLLLDCLIRIKETRPQVGLHSAARMKNIRNAFRVVNPDYVKGRRILLVDDVVTTGSTIGECSKVLKNAGAERIHVLSLAHAIVD